MEAGWRLFVRFAVAAAMAAAPAGVGAQSSDQPPPAEDSGVVGPRELENFSINGTVTQPAPERAAPAQPVARPPAPAPTTDTPPTTARPTQPAPSSMAERNAPTSDADRGTPVATAPDAPAAAPSIAAPKPMPEQVDAPETAPTSAGGVSILPWLLASLALVLGGLFLWWQKRAQQPAYADGPAEHAFAAPEPAPRPAPRAPAPAPKPAAPPASEPFAGLVTTRLRPWVDLAFEPARCSVEDDKVVIDFEIEMVNRGNAPARGVLVEARMVNAGPAQDAEIGQFFANPVGQGERIDAIAPMKAVRIKSRIVAPRDQVQIYDVGGRKLFVPLVAFNILYSWSRGAGQTSQSFLVGRDTKAEKLAPFRTDMGPRLFRGLGKQPLPLEIRQ
jgi:hypothetical protein